MSLELKSADYAVIAMALSRYITKRRIMIMEYKMAGHPEDGEEFHLLVDCMISTIRTWSKFAAIHPSIFNIHALPTLDAEMVRTHTVRSIAASV